MRLFVAVRPPLPVRERLAALDRPDVPGLRWTTDPQWHVTLRFLGALPTEEADRLRAALGPALCACSPAELRLGPATGRLGPSLLVVPVAGADGLAAAAAGATVGLGEEGRQFVGHLTLARARRHSRIPPAVVDVPVAATWVAGEVELVRSHLDPGGARYETLATFALRGTAGHR